MCPALAKCLFASWWLAFVCERVVVLRGKLAVSYPSTPLHREAWQIVPKTKMLMTDKSHRKITFSEITNNNVSVPVPVAAPSKT